MTGDLQDRLNAVQAALDEARASVEAGDAVDLTGLDETVRAICADLTATTAGDDRDELARAIGTVINDLDTLAAALSEQHRRAIAGSGLDAAAKSAYGEGEKPVKDPDGEN